MTQSRVRRIGNKRSHGFTLIEVIVATSLLAFGLALGFATLRGATRATEHAGLTAQRDERLRAVQGFLRNQINAALPMAMSVDADTGQGTFFSGSARKIEFVAAMPGYLSRGGPYVQTLEFVPAANGQELRFQHRLLTPLGPVAAEREPVVLADGIAEGSFEVRNLGPDSQPAAWQPTWNVPAQLPPLVRIRLRFRQPELRWPEFVAATRMGVAFAGDATNPQPGGSQSK